MQKIPWHRGDAGEKKAQFGRWLGVEKGALFAKALHVKRWPGQKLRGREYREHFLLTSLDWCTRAAWLPRLNWRVFALMHDFTKHAAGLAVAATRRCHTKFGT